MKKEYDLPMIYFDQNRYIHFETKNFHVWSKILMNENEAKEHMDFLKKNTGSLTVINKCVGDCNKLDGI